MINNCISINVFHLYVLRLVILLASPCLLSAQVSPPSEFNLKTIATTQGNNILLRWAPLDYEAWTWGNEHGYEVYRYTVKENGVALSFLDSRASKLVLDSMLLPLAEAEWQTMADTSDLAGLAAGAIHGTGFTVETADPNSLMDVYSVAQEEENRFGLSLFAADQDFNIAQAMALGIIDEQATPGNTYRYFVKAQNLPDSIPSFGTVVLVEHSPPAALPIPEGLEAAPGDSMVQLNWNNSFTEGHFTGFVVERSEDGGQTYQVANSKPILYTNNGTGESNDYVFIDSLANNTTEYIYRVRGKTPFAILGPPSDTIHVKGIPAPLVADLYLYELTEENPGQLTLKWHFPIENEGDIQGFSIDQAVARDSQYTEIASQLSPDLREYVYQAGRTTSAYYRIRATDNNGHSLRSPAFLGQLADSIPPGKPQGLAGTVDPSGMVSLNWTENPEEDILGYRVFMSNQENGTFTQITTQWLREPFYYHQFNLNTLSEEAYFKVMALDLRQNNSELSDAIQIDRPDIIPPARPAISLVEARQAGVFIQWQNSSSKDVVRHILERRLVSGGAWEELDYSNQTTPEPEYLDSTASFKYEYYYRVLAEDDAGLQSSSRLFKIRPLDSGLRSEITNLTVVLDRNKKVVRLNWNYPNVEGLYDFQIYRALVPSDPLRAYASAKPTDTMTAIMDEQQSQGGTIGLHVYEDEELLVGKYYEYKVMARYLNGAYSPLSVSVYVMVQ